MLLSTKTIQVETALKLVQECSRYYHCTPEHLVTLLKRRKRLILKGGARLYLQNYPRLFILETTRLDGIDTDQALFGYRYHVHIEHDQVPVSSHMRFFQAQCDMLQLCDLLDGASRICVQDWRGVVCEEWKHTRYGGWYGWKKKGM